ncbi:Aldehyde dehydrogenase [Plasmodiophora brassicae]
MQIVPTTGPEIEHKLERVRQCARNGGLSLEQRRRALKSIRAFLVDNREALIEVMAIDLRKPLMESNLLEIQYVINDVDHALSNLSSWMRPKYVPTPAVAFPAQSRVVYRPLGVVLVIVPFNFPVQLSFGPMISAIAAGNTVVLKMSEMTAATSNLIADLLPKYLDESILAVVQGAATETQMLLKHKFDHIFFTGSERVGRIVLAAAAPHLTPVTLELGGKSPAIVSSSANVAVAAKRIMWSKWINAGQVCIAADYAIVDESVYDEFINECRRAVVSFSGGVDPKSSPDFCRIITKEHTERLKGLLDSCRDLIVFGGDTDIGERFCAPTVVGPVRVNCDLMKSEIFGPILPVIQVGCIADAVDIISKNPNPLALYVFGTKKQAENIFSKTKSGSACVNDCVFQNSNTDLPFGGIGSSGMGKAHGETGFRTFSHAHSILYRTDASIFDVPQRYPPYTAAAERFLLFVMRATKINSRTLGHFIHGLLLTGVLLITLRLFRLV